MTDYATIGEFKALASDNATTSNPFPSKGDTNITRILTAASRTIDRYVSRTRPRTFAADADTTQTFNVLDRVIGNTLYLQTDVCSVTTVKNDTVITTNYVLLADFPHTTTYTRVKLTSGSWTYATAVLPDNAATVIGKFAYSAAPPADIVQACLQLAIAVWRQRNTVANIQTAMISADGTLVLPDGLPKSVVDLLEPYMV